MSDEFSINDVVPVLHAIEKKLKGTRPHSTKTGKFSTLFGKILVKMKVSTDIMMIGFNRDQNAPRDIFRYRIVKSFRINLDRRNR